MNRRDYDRALERVRREYEPKIKDALGRIAEEARSRGLSVRNVWFQDGNDEYTWVLDIAAPGREPNPFPPFEESTVGVSLTITEAMAHEGWDPQNPGISFRLDVIAMGGRIVGVYAPYNYTGEWVVDIRDDGAVRARWEELGDVGVPEVVDEIEDHIASVVAPAA